MPNKNLDLSKVKGDVVIIPAAGRGTRFSKEKPKQYQLLNGITILEHTLKLFLESKTVEKIVLVVSPEDSEYQKLSCIDDDQLIIIDGGDERQESVTNALRYLFDSELSDDSPVLVHDAVRPCLTEKDLDNLLSAYKEKHGCYFLAEHISNSIKKIDQDLNVLNAVERDDLVCALTPQLAPFITLKHAYSTTNLAGLEITDEVGALTNNDVQVTAVLSVDLNPKITYPKDLKLAEIILNCRSK